MEPVIGIRASKPVDLLAVLEIASEGFAPGTKVRSVKWLVNYLSRPGVQLKVDDAGAGLLRGFLLTETRSTGTTVEVIAVGEQFRKQGVGKRLLATVRPEAAAWVRSENTASQGLFLRNGWAVSIPPKKKRGCWVYFKLSKS
jgi:ribosomal protein S18 acetylase RimI-like enzyme